MFEQMDKSEIEIKILEWFIQKYSKTCLAEQIEKADVVKREYSGVGFFVHFKISTNVSALQLGTDYMKDPIDGPIIVSKELMAGAQAILFIKNGYIDMLEVYTFVDKFPKNLVEFELQDPRVS